MHLSSYDVVKLLFIKLCISEPIILITTVAILAQGTHWADAAKQAFFSQGKIWFYNNVTPTFLHALRWLVNAIIVRTVVHVFLSNAI